MPLDQLPPELLLRIIAHLPHPAMAQLCVASKQFHDLVLPAMYSTMVCTTLTGTLAMLNLLLHGDEHSYVRQYNDTVVALQIPRVAASHQVKTAIAKSLADALLAGHFTSLIELHWPFTYVRRGFFPEEGEACKFDEPLWEALLETKPSFGKLIVSNASHAFDTSALWKFKPRCSFFLGRKHDYLPLPVAWN